MPNFVLDASVIIKWFKTNKEEKIKEASSYLEKLLAKKIKISIPDLLFYEILNIASFDKAISSEKWQEIIEILFSFSFELYPVDKFLAKDIYQLSNKFNLTAYDATYLALAKRLNTVLVTSDKEILQKAPKLTNGL